MSPVAKQCALRLLPRVEAGARKISNAKHRLLFVDCNLDHVPGTQRAWSWLVPVVRYTYVGP